MKNLLWATLAMVMCLFAACSDDDDDKMPQGPVITYAGKLPSNVNGYIFTYDENGRCIQVKSGSYVLGEIDYDKGLLISDDEEAEVKFTGEGYIKSIKSSWNEKDEYGGSKGSGEVYFSYKGGQLTSCTISSSESGKDEDGSYSYKGTYKTTYTWKNGNLIKVESEGSEIEDGEKWEDGYTCAIEYGDQKNELGQFSITQTRVLDMEDFQMLGLVGMLGKASAYFPVSYTEVDYEKDSEGNVDEDESTSSMTYSLNQDGTIRTEKINNYSYPYSYVTVDEEEALGRSCQLGNDSKNLNFRSFFMRHRCRK